MISLVLNSDPTEPLNVLCLGAHSDDIEIGCGGTILRLAKSYPNCAFYWIVFSAVGGRREEAERAAQLFAGTNLRGRVLLTFGDGVMPYSGVEIKAVFENELKVVSPHIIFTHNGADAHQDHRLISELTWNTFRNHLILEYEIPKYDGDLGRPSFFVPLEEDLCQLKVQYLMDTFETQKTKHWFKPETFRSLMRLRGMECVAPGGYAEAFYCRKVVL